MSRLVSVKVESASGELEELYGAIESLLGGVPELFQAMGNSPAALSGFLGATSALGKGSLSAKERVAIALAVAEFDKCSYCLSAHTALGQGAGMTPQETCDIRFGQIQEPRYKALIAFVAAVLEKKGDVSDSDVQAVRNAGYTDGQITEILLTIALNYFTNIFNLVNKTKVDFPVVLPGQTVAV